VEDQWLEEEKARIEAYYREVLKNSVVYLHPWYWFALALNAGILMALWWARWPPASMVGS
jgi:hypothetical protein